MPGAVCRMPHVKGFSLPASWDHEFWFDADHNNTVDGSGNVSQVLDRFGGSHVLSQSTAGDRPALVNWQGRKAWSASLGNYLSMTSLTRAKPMTFIIVGQFPSSSISSNAFAQPFWATGPSPLVWGGNGGSVNWSYYNGSNNYDIGTRSTYFSTTFVWCCEILSAANTMRWAILPSGIIMSNSTVSTTAPGSYTAQTPRFLSLSSSITWNAPISVIAMSKALLTTPDRDYMMRYLASFYSIPYRAA